jgi:hypothetical protein
LFTLIDNNGNIISIETADVFIDGQPHLLILQKAGNAGANAITVFVDDMKNPVPTVTFKSQQFDDTSYSISLDMGFFVRSTNSGVDRFNQMKASFFEFNSDTYTQREREELKGSLSEI